MNKNITALFSGMHAAGIKYFLLTDFESDLSSKDVDLYVPLSFRNVFEETLRELHWYKRKELPLHLNHFFFILPGEKIILDVKYELSFFAGKNSCVVYKNVAHAIENAVLNRHNVYRPSGIDAILLYAAHVAFNERNKIEEKHLVNLANYLKNYREESGTSSEINVLEKIGLWLAKDKPQGLPALRDCIELHFEHLDKSLLRKGSHHTYGFGVTAVFVGTDGAGKTTLVQEVTKQITLKNNKLYLGMGENGWSFPIIKALYNYRLKIKGIRQIVTAFKNYFLLPVEFSIRTLAVKRKGKYKLILIDRLPGKMVLSNHLLDKMICKYILPKYDIVFFLYADFNTLSLRKPGETSFEKFTRDSEKFRNVADKLSGGSYIPIDTSVLSINEATEMIISEIFKCPKIYENLLTPI